MIIADRMESGLGLRMATAMVHRHRIDEGKSEVCVSAVLNHFRKMNALVTQVKKRPQGNNLNVEWVQGRKGITLQWLVMLGGITKEKGKADLNVEGLPEYYDEDKLPKLSLNQVVYFDKIHIQQDSRSGSIHSDKQICFPRNLSLIHI